MNTNEQIFRLLLEEGFGKLIEHWGVPDRFALMEQLGLKPPPKFIMKLMSFTRKISNNKNSL
jgi:hypothetical protein